MTEKNRRAKLRVSPEFLVDACKGLNEVRTFKVSKHALPDDAKLVNVLYAYELALVLESAHFDLVEIGKEPYLPNPEITTVRLDA